MTTQRLRAIHDVDKPYLIDDEPVTSGELIQRAADLDAPFAADWMKQTSVAARILRSKGYTVMTTTSQRYRDKILGPMEEYVKSEAAAKFSDDDCQMSALESALTVTRLLVDEHERGDCDVRIYHPDGTPSDDCGTCEWCLSEAEIDGARI